ncbi:terminase [Micromonospora sp. NPDC047548]|uniref:terminase n=1 Tax=Micromonospora sp. NPDC047548 TaxID=3155624 RepID=UPI0033DE32F3
MTPETSEGFELAAFAVEIGHPLLPFQRFSAIHGLELLPDGRPRFRIVLLLISRQNGKTTLPKVMCAWWQFRKGVPLILGTSTQLSYAKEAWQATLRLVAATRAFDDLHEPGRKWYRRTNGETESWSIAGARYKIAASNAEGGRSLTIDRGIADELRQHHTYEAWEAFEPACSPEDAQIWCLSNAGSDKSVVLNDLQDAAREFIETGVGDPRLGLIEYSAPEDADPEDVDALLQANPRVGYGLDLEVLLAAAARAKRLGGKALAGFQTERMCIRVRLMNPAIDPIAWRGCKDVGDLADVRSRLAACIDLSPDGTHATLAAAAVLEDGRVRAETVAEWTGPAAASQLERDLPGWVEKLKPKVLGWFPQGPAAAVAAKVADRRKDGARGWPPRGVKVAEIRGETTAVCMGLAKEVKARTLAHSGQAMLDAQVAGAEPLKRGDGWVFTRAGDKPVDAVYAVAGAAHLARTLPKPVGKPRVIVGRNRSGLAKD